MILSLCRLVTARRVSCPHDQHHVLCRQREDFSHPALTTKASSLTYQSHTEHAIMLNTLAKANVFNVRLVKYKTKTVLILLNGSNRGRLLLRTLL